MEEKDGVKDPQSQLVMTPAFISTGSEVCEGEEKKAKDKLVPTANLPFHPLQGLPLEEGAVGLITQLFRESFCHSFPPS